MGEAVPVLNLLESSHTADCGPSDSSDDFLQIKMLTYLDRLLEKRPKVDKEYFQIIYTLVGHEIALDLLESIICLRPRPNTRTRNFYSRQIDDAWDYGRQFRTLYRNVPSDFKDYVPVYCRNALKTRIEELNYLGPSAIEQSIEAFKRILNLDETESELCTFLFITSSYSNCQDFFEDFLKSNTYRGRRVLADVLGCRESNISRALNGKLHHMGVIEKGHGDSFVLESTFSRLLQDLDPWDIRTSFFKQIKPQSIPLRFHAIEKATTKRILDLLRYKPETSTHILLYGPPGTGKTSYAYGLAQKLNMDLYLLEQSEKADSIKLRAAITACTNVAKESEGTVVLADDCDSILNTQNSWSIFGERSDKRWLHEILETPGVRMVWIVNSIENLEESVARRFSFSLGFKAFNKRQRVQVWQNTVKTHKMGRLLPNSVIEDLADRYHVSPGVIEQVVRKVKECRSSYLGVQSSVELALESHQRLTNGGYKAGRGPEANRDFVVEGLNLSGTDTQGLLEELSGFNQYSRRPSKHGIFSMSLLFYGPSGTGKSAFARFIASYLNREAVVKRASDLFSKWVGETEQNIRRAYEEAQTREAVLIFDEADSLVFNRDRAERSWELSATNEFLTWMECFEGIQIFTTNRLADLDSASLRRFNHKVEFGYLKPEGNVVFYNRLLGALVGREADSRMVMDLKRLSGLTPGDFKVVRDRYTFRSKDKIMESELLEALREESRLKNLHSGKTNIGFV